MWEEASNMASLAVKSLPSDHLSPYEGIDKLPSSTLKRHPKMELNKEDLLNLLSYLEGELQARDVTIAALKAEKAKQLLYQAKYGRFGLGDPFHALQRDSVGHKDNCFDEAAVKGMYDNQLLQLENLIATQRKAQARMTEQLVAVEKRYHKVLADLEEERRKHAQDTAQGDDVTYLLEKERERLKQEVDFEKNQNKKLDKELKKVMAAVDEERETSAKHKQVALALIRERKKLVETAGEAVVLRSHLELGLQEEAQRLVEQQTMQLEAAMEKQLADFDMEREQLRARLKREEGKNIELLQELDVLRQQLEFLNPPTMGGEQPASYQDLRKSNPLPSSSLSKPQPAPRSFKNTPPDTPPEKRRVKPPQSSGSYESVGHSLKQQLPGSDSTVKRAIMQFNNSPKPDKMSTDQMPLVIEKGAELGPSRSAQVQGANSTVLTTPTGARISLNVGHGTGGNGPRKMAPVGRGTPPPIPPNKPQFVPQPMTPNKLRPVGVVHNSGVSGGGVSPTAGPGARANPNTQFGMTVSKDKTTASGDSHLQNSSNPVPTGNPTVLAQSSGSPSRKPTQSDKTSSPTSKPLITGIDDLLKSMGSGTSESDSSIVKHNYLPSSHTSFSTLQSSPTRTATPTLTSLPTSQPFSSSSASLLISSNTEPMSKNNSSSALLYPSPNPGGSNTPRGPISVENTGKNLIEEIISVPPLPTTSPPLSKTDVISKLMTSSSNGSYNELYQLLTISQVPVNSALSDGTTALHCAAEQGHADCIQLLLNQGAQLDICKDNGTTALHLAASEGHSKCITLLLQAGFDVNRTDLAGWNALHWAATNRHKLSCQLLVDAGADVHCKSDANWTPIHAAIHSGDHECLKVLLDHPVLDRSKLLEVTQLADQDGWTVAHLAAIRETKDCLAALLYHCEIDLDSKDKWGRTVLEVASKECRNFLETVDKKNERTCSIILELDSMLDPSTNHGPTSFHVGQLKVKSIMSWSALEHLINGTLMAHFSSVAAGFQVQVEDKPAVAYSLRLSTDSIKEYSIGQYKWQTGNHKEKSPFEILCSSKVRSVRVKLIGWSDGALDSLSYETLISLNLLDNYIRLIEQYKSVIFYGPAGTGKAHMTQRLAAFIQAKERQNGNSTDIHRFAFSKDTTRDQLIDELLTIGCLLRSSDSMTAGQAPIVIFENLHEVSVSQIFGNLLHAIENRGSKNPVQLEIGKGVSPESFFLLDSCYIIGTMDKARSGLELAIQQRFRWIYLSIEVEPIKSLLHRNLYRKYVTSRGSNEESIVRSTIEWIVLVWVNLNQALGKIRLAELVFGPGIFIDCPVESDNPKAILSWLQAKWNMSIAPKITSALSTGDPEENNAKFIPTVLYALLQRSVVFKCPLSGQEKELYISGFIGSSDRDIQIPIDDAKNPQKDVGLFADKLQKASDRYMPSPMFFDRAQGKTYGKYMAIVGSKSEYTTHGRVSRSGEDEVQRPLTPQLHRIQNLTPGRRAFSPEPSMFTSSITMTTKTGRHSADIFSSERSSVDRFSYKDNQIKSKGRLSLQQTSMLTNQTFIPILEDGRGRNANHVNVSDKAQHLKGPKTFVDNNNTVEHIQSPRSVNAKILRH